MRKTLATLTALAFAALGLILTAPTAQAGHANGICDGHWFQGNQNAVRGCYIADSGAPGGDYGQTDDLDPYDGHCAVAQDNSNGAGWHNITNSVSCGPYANWYLDTGVYPPWVRLVVGDGSQPGQIVTLVNCYTGYRC